MTHPVYRTILTWCSWQFWPLKLPTIFDTTMTSLFGQVKTCMFMGLSLSRKLWIFQGLDSEIIIPGLVFKKAEKQRYERFRFQTVQFKVKWIFNFLFLISALWFSIQVSFSMNTFEDPSIENIDKKPLNWFKMLLNSYISSFFISCFGKRREEHS